jgi:hypothetical protein
LIAEEKPDVVLMMGPFVDMRQEIVQNVEDLVLEYENGTKTHVYETTGGKRFSKKAKDRRVHLVPNPCTIQINEVTIGFTASLDAYMHMSLLDGNHHKASSW